MYRGCTPEEQAEHRKQWVAALRSGKYQQGEKRLRTGDKFCCLGVACDVSGLGQWVEAIEYDDDGNVVENVQVYSTGSIIASHRFNGVLTDWYGVRGADVYFDGEYELLTVANDNGYSFEKIAELIENEEVIIAYN